MRAGWLSVAFWTSRKLLLGSDDMQLSRLDVHKSDADPDLAGSWALTLPSMAVRFGCAEIPQ